MDNIIAEKYWKAISHFSLKILIYCHKYEGSEGNFRLSILQPWYRQWESPGPWLLHIGTALICMQKPSQWNYRNFSASVLMCKKDKVFISLSQISLRIIYGDQYFYCTSFQKPLIKFLKRKVVIFGGHPPSHKWYLGDYLCWTKQHFRTSWDSFLWKSFMVHLLVSH